MKYILKLTTILLLLTTLGVSLPIQMVQARDLGDIENDISATEDELKSISPYIIHARKNTDCKSL